MREALAAAALLLAACGSNGAASVSTTTDVTTPHEPSTTTTVFDQPFEVQDCSSPPVTFSALCEVYERVQAWHVDRPIDPESLAAIALTGLRNHVSTESEDRPRTLICAIPHESFTDLCAELAGQVGQSSIAVAPAIDDAVASMADLGLDVFTFYVPPDSVGSFRANGVVGGVGILLDATDAVGSRCAVVAEGCPLTIVFVLEENPGEEAGLMAGDVIVAVDGIPVEGNGFAAIATAIAGDETGDVVLTVNRNETTLEIAVQRAELAVPTVRVDNPQPGVGYLRIPDFESDIPALVSEGLDVILELQPHTLIIDLRDNPGGLVDAAIEVASLFIDGGIVLITETPDDRTEELASAGGPAVGPRLVVVINGGTASSAEVLAGALRDRRSAALVGTATLGKDAVQIPFELRNGGELHVTIARWSSPTGLSVGSTGWLPDHELDLPAGMPIEELARQVLEAVS